MARTLERRRCPFQILTPRGTATIEAVEIEGRRFAEVNRRDVYVAVFARRKRNPDCAINTERKDEAVVVVGVFPDKVDTARGANKNVWSRSELAGKAPND